MGDKNSEQLKPHKLFGTGTTASLISHHTGLNVTGMLSGPMGGDQQIGAMIAEQKIDVMIFSGIHSMRFLMIPMLKPYYA